MPLPKPPAPFRTYLGWSLGSEEAADKERLRIRKRQAIERREFNFIFGDRDASSLQQMREPQARMPEGNQDGRVDNPGLVRNLPHTNGRQVPPSAARLYAWLIGRGYRVYLRDGKVHAGPRSMSQRVREAIIREREGLRTLLEQHNQERAGS